MHTTRRALTPPGPLWPMLSFIAPWQDPLRRFAELARTYGDVVSFRTPAGRMVFLSAPQDIRDVLVTHQRELHEEPRPRAREACCSARGSSRARAPRTCRQRRLHAAGLPPRSHRARTRRRWSRVPTAPERAGATASRSTSPREMMQPHARHRRARRCSIWTWRRRPPRSARRCTRVLESLLDRRMLPFGQTHREGCRSRGFSRRRAARARSRRDHLPPDRRAARRRRATAATCCRCCSRSRHDEEGDGRGMTDAQVRDEAMTTDPRRPRDDGQRAHVDLVPAERARPRPSARCTPRSTAVLRRAAADARPTCRRCATSSRSSPRRCACIRRPGSSAAAPSRPYAGRRLHAAAADHRGHEPVRRAPRRALLPGSRPVRRRSAGRPAFSAALPQVRVLSRSAAGRASASASRSRGWSSTLVVATIAQRWRLRARARPSRRAAAARHAARQARHEDDGGEAILNVVME